jgi:hypothetical protein
LGVEQNNQLEGLIMKTILGLTAGLLVISQAGFAAGEVSKVPYELGPTYFRDGDQIVIDHVMATSPNLTVGDKVTVQGHYALKSEETAQLCLFLTTSEEVGYEPTIPAQRADVKKGSGSFELAEVVKHTGHLHLSFYPVPAGSRFGTVYFGTTQQMNQISNWDVTK